MGFGSSRHDDHTTEAETDSDQSRIYKSGSSTHTTDSPRSSGTRREPLAETEAHFGMEVPNRDTAFRLQRLEAMNTTQRVKGWVEEGMSVDDMGNPQAMEEFRQRQEQRPAEVPTNIEQQNRRSVQRSQQAAADNTRADETKVPEPVRDVIASTGRSLDSSIQRTMEDKMGDSFGDVQIHTGAQAAAACESINARAFTVGNNIAFNTGEYDPESPDGQHVLAHELARVRQQTDGAVSMLPQEDLELEIDPDPQLEREAEEAAQQVMAGGKLDIQRMRFTDVHVQRMPGPGKLKQARENVVDRINGNEDEPDVSADPESLAEEVGKIKQRQKK